MMKEFEGVSHSHRSGFGYCFDASVVVEGWCAVPGLDGVVSPGLAA